MSQHPFRNPDPANVSPEELQSFVNFINHLADASREFILPLFRANIAMDDKEGRDYYDPVTKADRGAEEIIRRLIKEHYPDHGIYGEEQGYEEGASPLTWVIDPVDGTRAFVLGLPLWGTLIALHNGARPILGLLDQPYLEERFIGAPDLAYAELITRQGRKPLRTRACPSLDKASMSSTHPSMFKEGPAKDAYDRLTSKVRLHSYGGDCYGYAMVTIGTHDLVVEDRLKPYDIQALIPIVEAAGGILTAWDGEPADLGGTAIVSGSREIHQQALEILRPAVSSGP